MLPLTADCPKPLLPVGPWTLVEHQVAALATAGVERIVLSTGYRHADFHDLVVRLRATGVELITTVEESPLGTGGGLRVALRALPDAEEVIVLNGDLLSGHDLRAQVDRLTAAPAHVMGVVHVREVADARPYGSVLADDLGRITAFVEKSQSPRHARSTPVPTSCATSSCGTSPPAAPPPSSARSSPPSWSGERCSRTGRMRTSSTWAHQLPLSPPTGTF